jgi:septal ring factor EnvC (AmiA/AmiB activator)
VAALLATQDRIADLRRQSAANATHLAELQRQRDRLTADIAATQAQVATDQADLGRVARAQYKAEDQTNLWQIMFGSENLSQAINRVVASVSVANRAHLLITRLRDQQDALAMQRQELDFQTAEVQQAQTRLAALRSQLSATAADYQAQLNAIDANSGSLLKQIQQVNAAIAAATSPPGGASPWSQQQIIAIIRAAAARYGVSGDKMVRVAQCESGLNPRAYDPASGASGLFQFMPGTFYGNGGHNIWDPYDQSDVASRMFSRGQGGSWSCQ